MTVKDTLVPSSSFEDAATDYVRGMSSNQFARLESVFGGGVAKRIISAIVQSIIQSVLSGSGVGPAGALDSLHAHNNEKLLVQVVATLPEDQQVALSSLGNEWRKLIALVIQGVLGALTDIPVVPVTK